MLIIDEFNALRMREETSILFEQVRSFGGNLVISAQGYSGLGPREYAERMLDSCSTYILHACSDLGPVSRRAGKKLSFEVSWTEDEEGTPRKHIRPRYDWRVPEERVIQQEEGQAFWIYRGRTQQVQTAMVPITAEQIREGWREIHREEEIQRAQQDLEERTRQEQQAKKKTSAGSTDSEQRQPVAPAHRQQDGKRKKKSQSASATSRRQQSTVSVPPATAAKPTMIASVSTVPTPPLPLVEELEEDDEPDRF